MKIRNLRYLMASVLGGLVLSLALILLVGQTAIVEANSSILYVASDGNCNGATPCYGNIQTAVDAAISGDIIKVTEGVYTDIQIQENITQVVYINKNIILQGGWNEDFTIRNPLAYQTILDGQRQGPVVHITSGSAPTIEGFVITNGDGSGVSPCGWSWVSGCGGGIYINHASPIISNNTISSNIGSSRTDGYGWGGGIHVSAWSYGGMNTQIVDNTIMNNIGSTANVGQGGGISLFGGAPLLENNRIEQNVGSTFSEGSGGGINSQHSSALIVRNIISGNIGSTVAERWGMGGGLYFQGGRPVLEKNQIAYNTANPNFWLGDSGGAIHFWVSGPFTVTNNLFIGNTGMRGSGVNIDGSSATNGSSGVLINNTFVENRNDSDEGEGIRVGAYCNVALVNNIVVSHTVGITVSHPYSSSVNATHNLFWANTNDPIVGSNAVIGSPEFVGNGDYHITLGSAALDAGINAGVATDIDGEARPFGLATDIGADEWATVQTTAEPSTMATITAIVYGLTTTVNIPSGAVTESTDLVYTAFATAGHVNPPQFSFAGHAFDLGAYRGGLLLDRFTFDVPVTLTLYYSDDDIAELDEETLVLKYWNGSEWANAACGEYNRQPVENWLAVPICHLSRFALFGAQIQPAVTITKQVLPEGQVRYGDKLTYTLVISGAPGAEVGIYDPLTSTTFIRFVEKPDGIEYANHAITGTMVITPTNSVTLSFVVQVGVPGTVGIYVDVSNTACIYPAGQTISMCKWSNTVTNQAYRPYTIFLPLVVRNQ